MSKSKIPFGENKSPKRENQVKIASPMEFGARLRAAAKDCNFTQSQLARALALPPSSMGRYWNGERIFPAEQLFRAADCLSVDPRWLITGEERATEISAAERALLADFRSLSGVQRDHLLQSAAILANAAHPLGVGLAPAVQPTLNSPQQRFRGRSDI